ncbi:SHOCT domain-containing protein [Trujillonella endophytica]|uniref:Short C-terminal domain-containing protein n=1 Tax=Trujillonella endophytica TaxID=673521 RepID=A0A1H8U0J9_9ACTN|nr:SHOCT domain-containing protein [Trujillella endophytica]SEO96353.1 Short C-terminal domain-containing protein [Trujillella endophytica]
MPGLLRGLARTAVVAGTASGVAGRVRRHQDAKFAERDGQTAADRQAAYQDDVASRQPAAPPPARDSAGILDQLKQLGELKAGGVLTEQEFAEQKARILAE